MAMTQCVNGMPISHCTGRLGGSHMLTSWNVWHVNGYSSVGNDPWPIELGEGEERIVYVLIVSKMWRLVSC